MCSLILFLSLSFSLSSFLHSLPLFLSLFLPFPSFTLPLLIFPFLTALSTYLSSPCLVASLFLSLYPRSFPSLPSLPFPFLILSFYLSSVLPFFSLTLNVFLFLFFYYHRFRFLPFASLLFLSRSFYPHRFPSFLFPLLLFLLTFLRPPAFVPPSPTHYCSLHPFTPVWSCPTPLKMHSETFCSFNGRLSPPNDLPRPPRPVKGVS